MKTHTSDLKNNIKRIGRVLDSKITYTLDNEEIVLGMTDLNSVTPNYTTSLLKSVMKQLDIDSNVEIPEGTVINYQLGVLVNGSFEYLNYGNYVVYKIEKQEDLRSYKITCYDKMLYSMKDYEAMDITYPINIRDYINAICNYLGLVFANASDSFANYNREITRELYLNNDGESLGYTFRDVLDELAQVTASNICINEETDELEIRYITDTSDTINEDFFKDINVNFEKKYGPINSIVISRVGGADNVFLQDETSIEQNGLCELKITDNQILNWNDRSDYLPDILNQLNGLEYYLNDYSSTGIFYYNVCDKYNASIDNNIYPCVMFNDEINITQGASENIYTELPDESKTDYSKSDKTDRRLNQTYLIVDKQEGTIQGLVADVEEINGTINENFTQIYQDITNVITNVQTSGGSNLLKNSVMFAYNEKGESNNWENNKETISYNNEQVLYNNEEITYGGINGLTIQSDTEAINAGGISGHSFTLDNAVVRQKVIVTANESASGENYYTFSTRIKKNAVGNCYIKIFNENEEYKIELNEGQASHYEEFEIQEMFPTQNYFIVEFYGSSGSGATFTDNMLAFGKYKTQWQQANGEIMNTQVIVDSNGMKIHSSIYEGNETIITPLEFAGYAMINGVKTKVFTLNNDTTEVEKLKVRKEIKMPPIKIVPITTGARQGWAFVPSGGDN